MSSGQHPEGKAPIAPSLDITESSAEKKEREASALEIMFENYDTSGLDYGDPDQGLDMTGQGIVLTAAERKLSHADRQRIIASRRRGNDGLDDESPEETQVRLRQTAQLSSTQADQLGRNGHSAATSSESHHANYADTQNDSSTRDGGTFAKYASERNVLDLRAPERAADRPTSFDPSATNSTNQFAEQRIESGSASESSSNASASSGTGGGARIERTLVDANASQNTANANNSGTSDANASATGTTSGGTDRKSTRLNSSHSTLSRMPSSA